MKNPLNVKSISFEELKSLFDKRIFAIPDIQREFVWTKKKIITFLDSIKKHYPIGSFLICKIPSSKQKNIREGTAIPFFNQKNEWCYLVIDGQQRLSVLYSLINGRSIKTNRYQYPIESKFISLSKNKNSESEYEFYDEESSENIALTEILNKDIKNIKFSSKKTKRIKESKEAFEKYSFPFIFIEGFDEKKMEEAFVRLNTGGTSLSTVDRLLAESYHKDIDLRSHINNLIAHDLKRGFEYIDRIHIVKSIAANLGQKDFVGSTLNGFAKKLANPRDQIHCKYKKNHKKIKNAIIMSADFLVDKFGNASYLPYPAMLSILSIFYFENNLKHPVKQQIEELMKWFWITGFTQRYSGSKQRPCLLNDAEEMRKLANNKNYKLNLEGRQKNGRISVNYLLNKIKYTTRGAQRNTFFCYLINQKPLTFENGQPLLVEKELSSIFNSKNDHHIFPRDILKQDFTKDEINKLGNICFLRFDDNQKIKNKLPWIYLREYSDLPYFNKVLKSNLIPNSPSVLQKGKIIEQYLKFLKEREKIIQEDLISLIGKKYIEE